MRFSADWAGSEVIFCAGGGTVTFGAPMVVHSEAPDRLFRQLATMERRAESSGGAAAPQLQFHNLVNNADVVPRLLGTSLDMLHAVMESYVPLIRVSDAIFESCHLRLRM